MNVPAADPVHKATIIPRGRALGMVMQLPEGDRYSMKFKQMTSRLAIMMGGRVAEELTFGPENVTSGAQSDIDQATKLARAMVTQYARRIMTECHDEWSRYCQWPARIRDADRQRDHRSPERQAADPSGPWR
jgi:hypothetical protein